MKYLHKKLNILVFFTEKLFNGQVFDRSYLNKKGFNKHSKVHENLTKCDICLKVFSSKQSLKIHYRTHTGEKPFACPICDKRFAQKTNLVKHQAVHSDYRPFKCSICPEGKYFKTKTCLSRHMVYHYEPKFSCSFCDYKSYTKNDLNTHVKNKHFKTWTYLVSILHLS